MNEHWPASFDTMIDRLTGVLEREGKLLSRDEIRQIAVDDAGVFLLAYGEFHDAKELGMLEPITVNNGRRWLALAKRDDGSYEMRIMLGDDEKPLATLPFDEGEWRKLVEQATGLLSK